MYRQHSVTYLFPREIGGWRNWLASKRTFYFGGRVTLLGITIEWTDYHLA